MNCKTIRKILCVVLIILFIIPTPVMALSQEAEALRDLGIIMGGDRGVNDVYMASSTSRLQGAIMLLRLMQLEDEAFAFEGGTDFADTADYGWEQGKVMMRYLKAHKDVGFSGYPDGTFKPADSFTAQQYYKVLLEILGYRANIDFSWNEVFSFAGNLGFSSIHNKTALTMEDVAQATVEALRTPLKNESRTLAQKFVDEGVINEAVANQYSLLDTKPVEPVQPSEPVMASGPLSTQSIVYEGGFRLPDESMEHGWLWSGEALTYNPSGNGGKGSLFGTGHNHLTQVSEITIPTPVKSKSVSSLPYAETLQPFTEIRGGLFGDRYFEIPRVGLEVVNDKLYFCWGDHMQDDGNPPSHGYVSTNLSALNTQGLWSIGGRDYNYTNNDYLFKIPNNWAAQYTPGYDLATGRYRDGGWGGMGPSAILIQSSSLALGQSPVIKPLIRYTDISNYAGPLHTVNNYSEADSWTGAAWVESNAGGALIYIGTHGYGNSWYGFANGVVFPTDGEGPFPETPDYPYDERGWWNNDFRAAMMLYDSSDLGKVAQGQLEPHAVQPYAFLDLTQHMLVSRDITVMRYIGGVAYDDVNQRIFVMELHADGEKPVIHVFGIE